MRKIPTLFVRDFTRDNGRYVTTEVTPGCEWVLAGEGVATRKYDGTCVMFDGTDWWARREVKAGKTVPEGFVAVETDDTTGKTVGWEPIGQSSFARWHAEALAAFGGVATFGEGTYELCGPKINGDPDQRGYHVLISHAGAVRTIFPFARPWTPLMIEDWVRGQGRLGWEGIVWHHPDGRMAKLKARDFRPVGGEVQPNE